MGTERMKECTNREDTTQLLRSARKGSPRRRIRFGFPLFPARLCDGFTTKPVFHRALHPLLALSLTIAIASCTLPRIIIHNDPLTAEEHNNLGLAYESEGQYKAAGEEYEKALKKRSGWSIPLFNLGNIAYRQGDRDAAERYYRKAIAADPRNAAAWNNLALLLAETNRREEALRAAQKAVSLEEREAYRSTLNEIESTSGPLLKR